MKKILSFIFASFCVLFYCACNNTHVDSTTDSCQDSTKICKDEISYTIVDDTVYMMPVNGDIFFEGLLDNNKTWFEYIAYYTPKGYDVYTDDIDADWSVGYVTFSTCADGELPALRDTICYRVDVFPRDTVTKRGVILEAFSLDSPRISAAGIRAKDPLSKLKKLYNIPVNDNTKKVIIANPVYVTSENVPNYGFPQDISFQKYPEQEYIYQYKWDCLPEGIAFLIDNDTIQSIRTTNLRPDGSYFSP